MFWANASGEHKMKLFCIGKAKYPRSFKGTEIKHFPVNYYHSKLAWMTRDILSSWFHSKFVPEVNAFLKSVGLPVKAVLFIDNAPSHPNETELKSHNGNIFAFFPPPNIASLLQPMDQGVIVTMKRHYRRELLSLLLAEEQTVTDFWKKVFNIKEAIYLAAKAWGMISNQNIIQSWRKLNNNAKELVGKNLTSDNEETDIQISSQSLCEMIGHNNKFGDVDEENMLILRCQDMN
ncbi:hypothetical protein ANN_26820 [Periplaneta americana]|uniref:DDE-1 domain-containing protein n=1 Tax=Periplaneta americana TaxID=6978 RepID=A0ABQ8RZA2_PERAM|nr:hypothetical protein ANN_26820 [Periplaneta americana]